MKPSKAPVDLRSLGPSFRSFHELSSGSARLEVIRFRKPIINPDVMIGALYILLVIVQIPIVTELNVNRSLLVDYSRA